jgi:hypothetical protein
MLPRSHVRGGAAPLHPPAIAQLREEIAPLARALDDALTRTAPSSPARARTGVHAPREAADLTLRACERFCEQAPPDEGFINILARCALRAALEKLYPLHRHPPVGRYFCVGAFSRTPRRARPESAACRAHRAARYRRPRQPGERRLLPLRSRSTTTEAAPGRSSCACMAGREAVANICGSGCAMARGRGSSCSHPRQSAPVVDDRAGRRRPALTSMVRIRSEQLDGGTATRLAHGLSDGATYGLMLVLSGDPTFARLPPSPRPAPRPGSHRSMAAGKRCITCTGFWTDCSRVARRAGQTNSSRSPAPTSSTRDRRSLAHVSARRRTIES